MSNYLATGGLLLIAAPSSRLLSTSSAYHYVESDPSQSSGTNRKDPCHPFLDRFSYSPTSWCAGCSVCTDIYSQVS